MTLKIWLIEKKDLNGQGNRNFKFYLCNIRLAVNWPQKLLSKIWQKCQSSVVSCIAAYLCLSTGMGSPITKQRFELKLVGSTRIQTRNLPVTSPTSKPNELLSPSPIVALKLHYLTC